VRRSTRILLNAATLLSLIMCSAAVVLWVRGGPQLDRWLLSFVEDGGKGAESAAHVYSALFLLLVPRWLMVAATGLLPVLWLTSVYLNRLECRRRATIAAGRCPACGYDCRATPERCPECGNAVVARM
jgi:hypothetical protein